MDRYLCFKKAKIIGKNPNVLEKNGFKIYLKINQSDKNGFWECIKK